MAIMKKEVKNHAGISGKLYLPKELVGQQVYIVTKEAALELEELVAQTLLLRRLNSDVQNSITKDIYTMRESMEARLERLEKIVLSKT